MVHRTQTMYIEKLNVPIEDDPPAFSGYRGEKRAVWQFSQFG